MYYLTYRSKNASSIAFLMDFHDIFDPTQETLVVGDLNLCSKSESNHSILRQLKSLGFKQLVREPTHVEGRTIDLVFVYSPVERFEIEVKLESPYFSDHDILYVHKVRYINRKNSIHVQIFQV